MEQLQRCGIGIRRPDLHAAPAYCRKSLRSRVKNCRCVRIANHPMPCIV